MSKPTLVQPMCQGLRGIEHGAMPLEVGGAVRSRLEAPAFAKATPRQGGRREDFRLEILEKVK